MDKLIVFQDRKIRRIWHDDEWYFSIIDIVAVLTDSVDPVAYWRKLKQRLKEDGNETVTNCHALKMPASDGKLRLTDVAGSTRKDIEQRLGDSVVSNDNFLENTEEQKRLSHKKNNI